MIGLARPRATCRTRPPPPAPRKAQRTPHAIAAALRLALYTAAGTRCWRVARTALARWAAGESDRARPERGHKGQPLSVGCEELDDVPWLGLGLGLGFS